MNFRLEKIGILFVLLSTLSCKNLSKIEQSKKTFYQENATNQAFDFRSMHLDVARHFFPVEVIKQYIDSLAANNFNYFHWHLTDDQGWRIEIKKYPLLTEVGAWREEQDGTIYGGFYTQQDLKQLVAYAQEKNIEIIPEIDMPGHSSAAIAAYPWLSCEGIPIKTPYKHGIYKTILCPKDTVQVFLKDVFDEICEMFPGKYIHIGGDEVPKKTWKKYSGINAIMKKHEVRTMNELQNYWMTDLATYLQKKGKSVIVWGDVTNSEFSKDLIIMSWEGKEAGIKAARQGNKVIMTSKEYCYYDYPQYKSDKKLAAFYQLLTNEKVKQYDLYSDKLTKQENMNIIGGGGMMWTEFISDTSQLWHQFSPRVSTLGKVLSTKNYLKEK